jgi:hypothetical protein
VRLGLALRAEDTTMKIHSKPIEENAEVPLADDSRWEAIVSVGCCGPTPRRVERSC